MAILDNIAKISGENGTFLNESELSIIHIHFFVFAGFIKPIYQLFGRQVIFTVLSFLLHHFTYMHSKSSVTPDLVYFMTADYCKNQLKFIVFRNGIRMKNPHPAVSKLVHRKRMGINDYKLSFFPDK